MHRRQEAQDGVGGDVGPLALGVCLVRENARAYPGRRRLATILPRYSAKSAGRRPGYSFGRHDFQARAAHGRAMAARR
ncbi:MAG TPA: hypothetical protein VHF26_21340 [Trebonia sp.]|nr:hypothetical protein [Trebonia sp.]